MRVRNREHAQKLRDNFFRIGDEFAADPEGTTESRHFIPALGQHRLSWQIAEYAVDIPLPRELRSTRCAYSRQGSAEMPAGTVCA